MQACMRTTVAHMASLVPIVPWPVLTSHLPKQDHQAALVQRLDLHLHCQPTLLCLDHLGERIDVSRPLRQPDNRSFAAAG